MDTVALVDRMVDSYNRHDLDDLGACYAPGARINLGWPEDVDPAGWLAGFGQYLGETDRLILGTTAEALPATGRAMDIAGTVVLELDGGQVTAERHYWPAIDMLVQLGLVG